MMGLVVPRYCRSFLPTVGLAVMTASGVAAQGPSFDCAKASTPVERSICASDRLSRLDREMASVYAALRSQLGSVGRQRLLDAQRTWLAYRDTCGDDEACLVERMSDRIAELRSESAPATAGSNQMPPGIVGHWGPYSDTTSPDGVQLSPGVADFGIAGRYEISPVRPGGSVFRITNRSRDASQLVCGLNNATYVAFMPAGRPVVGSGELLEVQFTADSTPLTEPDPSTRMQMLPGSCSMAYYVRQ